MKRWSRARFFSRALCLTEKAPGETVFEDLIPPGLPVPMRLTGLGASLFGFDENGFRDIPLYSGGWTPSLGGRDLTTVDMPLWAKKVRP